MPDATDFPADPDTFLATLPNGVRLVAIALPQRATASVSVFVHSGSQHESRRQNGISHFAEHMAFKGTATRDCQRINLDAERLGAEVNAHTDKDHTAYHMTGLAGHAEAFIRMLGDIVLNGSWPEAELERERQVILQEVAEDEDDALSTAFKLFDTCCWGDHAVARPVIGSRRNIERFTRDELLGYVRRQYSGANLVVGVAGAVAPDRLLKVVEEVFGAMPAGLPNEVAPPSYRGGVRTRRVAGSGQAHAALGFPIPSLSEQPLDFTVAAALFGEGMSSPLMDEIRERRGLVYYAACSADVQPLCGQFVVEASMAPEHLDEYFGEVLRLLHLQAERIQPVDLERARNQLAVRSLRAQEHAGRRLEAAVQDLFVHGRVRSQTEWLARMQAVDSGQVRSAFERLLQAPAAVAVAGKLPKGLASALGARFATQAV